MTEDDRDRDAVRLAAEASTHGDATGWFDQLYVQAATGDAIVPWDRPDPNPVLVGWVGGREHGGRAMVVGAGLGTDSEFVASLGYETVAFDVSPAAVAGARARYPESTVTYEVADLFDLPGAWDRAFDLVVESFTVQSLPVDLHQTAIDAVASLVAPGGTVLVIGAVGTDAEDVEGPPWPLTPSEMDRFGADLDEVSRDVAGEGKWRWCVELRRPGRA